MVKPSADVIITSWPGSTEEADEQLIEIHPAGLSGRKAQCPKPTRLRGARAAGMTHPMFLNFLDELRRAGIPASIKEHLMLLEALDRDRYDVVPVGIAKDGHWVLAPDDPQALRLAPGHVPEVDTEAASVIVPTSATDRTLVVHEAGRPPRTLGEVDVPRVKEDAEPEVGDTVCAAIGILRRAVAQSGSTGLRD